VVSTRGRLDIVKPRRSVPHIILNRQTPFTLLSVRDTAPTGMVARHHSPGQAVAATAVFQPST